MRRIVLLVGIPAFVFVVVLPRIVDYDAVAGALRTLSLEELGVLVVATVVAFGANAGPARALIQALLWPHAIGADIAGRAVVSTIPGPTDIATKFVLYRQWGIPADSATAGIVFAAFFEVLATLVLPVISLVGVIVTGNATRPNTLLIAAVGVGIFVGAVLLLVGIVRSEALARRFGGLRRSPSAGYCSSSFGADIGARSCRTRAHPAAPLPPMKPRCPLDCVSR
jgi:putative heme transporter